MSGHPLHIGRLIGRKQEFPATSETSFWASAPRDGWQQTYERETERMKWTRYGKTDYVSPMASGVELTGFVGRRKRTDEL